jgi:hypothetical protein
MNNECFERLMMTDERKEDKVRKRLSLGWTPSPAYPSRLGVASSVLIELRCKLSEIYLPQVGSSDELTYFLTYSYLFSDKYVKYQLKTFLVFLMAFALPQQQHIILGGLQILVLGCQSHFLSEEKWAVNVARWIAGITFQKIVLVSRSQTTIFKM